MEFLKTEKGMIFHQRKYVREVLKKFNMFESNPSTSPVEADLKLKNNGNEDNVDATLLKQIVSSLRYLCNT